MTNVYSKLHGRHATKDHSLINVIIKRLPKDNNGHLDQYNLIQLCMYMELWKTTEEFFMYISQSNTVKITTGQLITKHIPPSDRFFYVLNM